MFLLFSRIFSLIYCIFCGYGLSCLYNTGRGTNESLQVAQLQECCSASKEKLKDSATSKSSTAHFTRIPFYSNPPLRQWLKSQGVKLNLNLWVFTSKSVLVFCSALPDPDAWYQRTTWHLQSCRRAGSEWLTQQERRGTNLLRNGFTTKTEGWNLLEIPNNVMHNNWIHWQSNCYTIWMIERPFKGVASAKKIKDQKRWFQIVSLPSSYER